MAWRLETDLEMVFICGVGGESSTRRRGRTGDKNKVGIAIKIGEDNNSHWNWRKKKTDKSASNKIGLLLVFKEEKNPNIAQESKKRRKNGILIGSLGSH